MTPFWIWHENNLLSGKAATTSVPHYFQGISKITQGLQPLQDCLFHSRSVAQRASSASFEQPQSPEFKFPPHFGQRPLHSSLHTVRIGNSSKTCSRRTSSSRRPSPS